jgi:hypothetical protein
VSRRRSPSRRSFRQQAGHPSDDPQKVAAFTSEWVAAFVSEWVAAFASEWWPPSSRNGWPASLGIRKKYRARLRKKQDFDPRSFAEEETVALSQLPCWRHLSPEVYRDLVAGLVREIEADAAAARKLTGREPLGPEAILSSTFGRHLFGAPQPHTCLEERRAFGPIS